MRFLFDVDGTLLTQQAPGEYGKAKPIEGRMEIVNKLFDDGHQIVFYTSRNFKYMQMTYKQLRTFGFKFHHIAFGKPHADFIVDDRLLSFEGLIMKRIKADL